MPGWLLPRGDVTPQATLFAALTDFTALTTALQILA